MPLPVGLRAPRCRPNCAGKFFGHWPLRPLDLVDRSARGLQARALGVHQLTRAAGPCLVASARRGAAGRRCRPILPVKFSRPPWTGAAAADRAAGDVRQVGAAGPPSGQPAACRCRSGGARLDAVRMGAGEFLGRWPLRPLDLVDRAREPCKPAPWACTSWRAWERPAARQRPLSCCRPSMPPCFTCEIFSVAVDRRRCS
ncbi:hypothetical protein JAB4_059700 (plasmid) [Janthinobacterium sp. HH102]|nr:hypothetical protein JAB4_059700 [Janthinobacterium sp. HH102]